MEKDIFKGTPKEVIQREKKEKPRRKRKAPSAINALVGGVTALVKATKAIGDAQVRALEQEEELEKYRKQTLRLQRTGVWIGGLSLAVTSLILLYLMGVI